MTPSDRADRQTSQSRTLLTRRSPPDVDEAATRPPPMMSLRSIADGASIRLRDERLTADLKDLEL
jgi:hypothetical protein